MMLVGSGVSVPLVQNKRLEFNQLHRFLQKQSIIFTAAFMIQTYTKQVNGLCVCSLFIQNKKMIMVNDTVN